MFEKVTVHRLFPTFVWEHALAPEVYEPLNVRLAEDLDRMTAPRPQLAPGQGWQTDHILHEMEEFRDLVGIINAASKDVLDRYRIEYDTFMITGCWANIGPIGAFHIPHIHPNNFLSGVYYVKVQDGADTISFHDPRPQQEVIAPDVIEQNQLNSTVHQLKLKPGRLVIFPAWFVHSVPRNESNGLRISITFNVMFSSFAEKISRPKWTGIPVRAKSAS